MNIFEENEKILAEWKVSNEKYNEFNFAPDGIMFRGDFVDYEGGTTRLPSADGRENEEWSSAKLRILFLTKDQNSGGDEAWDVRGETINFSYAFYRNLSYQLYGLVNTTDIVKANYEFSYDDAKDVYNNYPFARINVKKESGESSIDNSLLRTYLERDAGFIIRQIENLNPDILVCCGYSQSIEESGNLILNFLNHNGFNFKKATDDNWMYYDEKRNTLAVNNWHLSVRTSPETIYTQMVDAYFEFLQSHPKFADAVLKDGKDAIIRKQRDEAIFNEIKKLIEENCCSDKVFVENENMLKIKVLFGGTAFAIMYGFFETGECGIFLRQENTSLGVGRSKSIIKKLAETLGVRYDKPEYFLQIIYKGDVDVVEEIKKIILKICVL